MRPSSVTFAASNSQLPLWGHQDGPAMGWTVRHSRRARRLSVRVFRSGQVEVVVPPRTPARTVEGFLAQHRAWIERKRTEALGRRRLEVPEPFPPQRIELASCAASFAVHVAGGEGHLEAFEAPGWLTLRGRCESREALRQALLVWLKDYAYRELSLMLAAVARELGFTYRRVAVRRQRTRWGSCSRRGTISLNCCLMFQRPEVVRYLLIHELAHTVHMNHSMRFWQCVQRHCPQYEQLDRELAGGWKHVPSWVFDS